MLKVTRFLIAAVGQEVLILKKGDLKPVCTLVNRFANAQRKLAVTTRLLMVQESRVE